MDTLHVDARRWFQKSFGNTYHSVRIFHGGELIGHVPMAYGYGEQCLQTALDWLALNGVEMPKSWQGNITTHVLREMGATFTIKDVSRKKDL